MREYENKLANVKKSCDVARKVAKVLSIIMAIGTAFILICGLVMVVFKSEINTCVKLEHETNLGETMVHIYHLRGTTEHDLCTLTVNESSCIVGTTYLVKKFIDKAMYAEAMAVMFFSVGVLFAIIAGIFNVIMKAFKLIEDSDTPFDGDVMKKLKTAFIIITVYTFFFVGVGVSILAGVMFWSIYCILDYGYVLQKESDETL